MGGRFMTPIKPHWKSHHVPHADQGAAVQQFVATVDNARLEIEVVPWGDGTLKVNGVLIAQVHAARSSREALRDLKTIAARHLRKRAAAPTRH
jgi:enoyl-[acyl-carrier protein] reductase I